MCQIWSTGTPVTELRAVLLQKLFPVAPIYRIGIGGIWQTRSMCGACAAVGGAVGAVVGGPMTT